MVFVMTVASPKHYTQDEKKCKYRAANLGATMSSYRDIKKKSESDLQVAVGTVGPISVAIDASHTSFQVSRAKVNSVVANESQHTIIVFYTFVLSLAV